MKGDVFPVGLKLGGLSCLVVGHGDEADRRTLALVEAGARLSVVSDAPTETLLRLAKAGQVELRERVFTELDLDGVWLVVLTDRDAELASRIAQAAKERRVFFCAVDQPPESTFSHLAIARSGPVAVAVSTNGRAPALARRLKEELSRVLDEADVGAFAARVADLRERTPSAERQAVIGRAVAGLRLVGHFDVPNGTLLAPHEPGDDPDSK